MVGARRPKLVVTIHGIQTTGKWQKKITPYLARHGLIPYHIDYGWFNAIGFFFPWSRERRVRLVREELQELIAQSGARRISVIAHSFGTYLAMEVLKRENGSIKYDRVVLTGSIVPRDFDWDDAFAQSWVMAARNERATSDRVVTLAYFVSRRLRWICRLNAGDSGRNEFAQKHPSLIDAHVTGKHSDTHNALKFDRWARFIAYPNLPEDVLTKVTTEMQALRQEAAAILGEPPDRIRVNLFAPIDGALRIVPGAVDNMNYVPELDLRIELGHGATGTSFASGNSCIVVKRGATWPGGHLPGDELKKINPALRWVISLPVKSEARGKIIGVVNVDGLDNLPLMLQDASSEECKATMLALHGGMVKRFEPCLDAAFRGEQLPGIEV